MIDCPAIQPDVIRNHYDLSTLFYRLLWGPHIHHGYWEENESPRRAQLQLTEQLARRARIGAAADGKTANDGSQRILDVGCGMGASSIHLANTHDCKTVGVTISPLQCRWAKMAAQWQGVRRKCDFRCVDAEDVEFAMGEFDVVWSIECTEHLFNKPRFIQRAAQWLKPNGRIAICAWLAGDDLTEGQTQQVCDVCEGFFCPSLGTSDDYISWFEDAGLEVEVVEDWTSQVERTWEICRERVRQSRVRLLAKWIDSETVLFLDRFETILNAYCNGAMKYGCFVARNAT